MNFAKGKKLDLNFCLRNFNFRTCLLDETLKLLLIIYVYDQRSLNRVTRTEIILIQLEETTVALFNIHLKFLFCLKILENLGGHVMWEVTLLMND